MPAKMDDDMQRVSMVVPAKWLKQVDEWRRREPDNPNVSEAIRRLVDAGLAAKKKGGKHDR